MPSRAADIDVAKATQMLEAALVPAGTPEAQEAHLRDQHRARAQLHIAPAGREGHGHG
jgi:hypothetical protein